MRDNDKIQRKKQAIARAEKSLALEKLKKRRAETRNKIQLGGLVIKSKMDMHSKEIIIGALIHAFNLMDDDPDYQKVFSSIGMNAFLEK